MIDNQKKIDDKKKKPISIDKAREVTRFEKCEFTGDDECETCKSVTNRYNSLNEKKTSFEYDDFDYICNRCVKIHAGHILDEDLDFIG